MFNFLKRKPKKPVEKSSDRLSTLKLVKAENAKRLYSFSLLNLELPTVSSDLATYIKYLEIHYEYLIERRNIPSVNKVYSSNVTVEEFFCNYKLNELMVLLNRFKDIAEKYIATIEALELKDGHTSVDMYNLRMTNVLYSNVQVIISFLYNNLSSVPINSRNPL